VAASTASIVELWPQIGPQSDLWRVPAYLHGINELRKQTEEIDRRHSALRRIGAARQAVIETLRQGRLLAAQAVDRFRELDVLRTESGLGSAPDRRHFSGKEIARLELVGWLKEVRRSDQAARGNDVLARAIQDLESLSPAAERGSVE